MQFSEIPWYCLGDTSEREKRILFIHARKVLKPGTLAPCRLIILNIQINISDAGMTHFRQFVISSFGHDSKTVHVRIFLFDNLEIGFNDSIRHPRINLL